jgi:DNA gyrase subunit A
LTACANGYGKRTYFGPGASAEETETEEETTSSTARYRTQHRGGKGVRDIKTTERNGPVIGVIRVNDDDELLMMTARGKIQRIKASDVSVVGRNTQGVRIMSLSEGDSLAAIVPVPYEEQDEIADTVSEATVEIESSPEITPDEPTDAGGTDEPTTEGESEA